MSSMFEIYARLFRNKRLLILVGALSGSFAILSFFSEPFLIYFGHAFRVNIGETSVPITLLLISIVSFSFIYLQSGGKETPEIHTSPILEKVLDELAFQKHRVSIEYEELKQKLEKYELEKGLSEEEKQAIIAGAVDQTSREAIKTIFQQEADKLTDEIRESLGFERLGKSSWEITQRLRREITDLRLRSNINLLIGMAITAGGLYLLWTTVAIVDASQLLKELASEGQESNIKFFKNLVLPIIPRVLLVIFVEVFAYFFLRLYKDGLSEIKYFQNELTNVEAKLAAVQFSFITNNSEGLKASIESLSKTERNFILEKGQTTVELERAKSESELTRNIIKTIPDFFKKSSK